MVRENTLTPYGLFFLGCKLEELKSILASSSQIDQILAILERFSVFEDIDKFEEIGRGAGDWYAALSKQRDSSHSGSLAAIDDKQREALQDAVAVWKELAAEKVEELLLVTPDSNLASENLMEGVEGFLEEELVELLSQSEREDLTEACNCLLVGSNAAAEFICLRCAESLLLRWHENKTGQALEEQAWGAVLDKVAEAYQKKGRPEEIRLLGYLQERRDEIACPERPATAREAEDTLMKVFSLLQSLKDYLV